MQQHAQTASDWRQLVAQLAEEYRAELHRYLLIRLKSEELTRDIIQDTFAKVLTLDTLEHIENPRAYIFRIACNLAIDHLRSTRPGRTDSISEVDEGALPSTGPSPEDEMRARQLSRIATAAFHELPERSREIFYLRRVEGMSTCEIASRYGVSQRMVQKSFAQIMNHFGRRLAAYRQT